MKKFNISALKPETIKDIEALIGSELAHLVAVDTTNQPILLSDDDIKASPANQTEVNQLTATRMCRVLIGGVWIYFPC
ncbi:hypothetical protein [Crenothrix sp.]|uniref:hypothetical protein n=1 Tax=Crenothrix sp. TaxID=3100433 RepID=UPI00374C8BFA